MFQNYYFWNSLFHPTKFMNALEHQELRGYRKKVLFLFICTVLFFTIRSAWGVDSENLTYLFAQNNEEQYTISRYLATIGAFLYGIAFFIFQYYIMSYVFSILTDIPFKMIKRIQVFVIVIYLLEKLIIFASFILAGYATNLSFLSIAPIVANFTNEQFTLFTVNQLSVGVILAIVVQYIFLSKSEDIESKNTLLIKIIFIHVLIALIIGGLSISPYYEWIVRGLA